MFELIILNGVQYPVRGSYYVLKHFRLETGRDLDSFDNLTDIEPVLYFSLIAGHRAAGKEMPFKREDMEYLIDLNLQSILKDLPKLMKHFSMQDGEGDGTKKKLVDPA